MTELSSRQRAGYVLGMIVGFANLPGAFVPGGEDGSGSPTGPPVAVLALGAVLGLVVMALLYQSWRTGRRAWLRSAAVLMILLALLALPGVLTPTVDAWIRVLAGAYVLLTVAALALLFAPAARRTPSLA
jgi:hypothetical protein